MIGLAKAKKAEPAAAVGTYNTKGERIGKCGDSKKGEGNQMKNQATACVSRAKGGKKAIVLAVSKKRREDQTKK